MKPMKLKIETEELKHGQHRAGCYYRGGYFSAVENTREEAIQELVKEMRRVKRNEETKPVQVTIF